MITNVFTAVQGDGLFAEPVLVEVQTNVARGIPQHNIVGLASTGVKEARERVRSAITSAGVKYPRIRITQSFAPANIKKTGSHLDLPLALGIAMFNDHADLDGIAFFGELSLDGRIRPVENLPSLVNGLPLTVGLIVLPEGNRAQGRNIEGYHKIYYSQLAGIIRDIKDGLLQRKAALAMLENKNRQPISVKSAEKRYDEILDFSDVYGHQENILAMVIAAMGGQHMLLAGPPGSGKSMLAARYRSLLDSPSSEKAIDIWRIMGSPENLKISDVKVPIRSPHHTITHIGMVGGSSPIRFGEVSKAHHGILLLEELGEFNRAAIEVLREPLENKYVSIVRSTESVDLPADFTLISTMNTCACGHYKFGSAEIMCDCSISQIKEYYKKLSWPILERIDILLQVDKIHDFSPENKKSAGYYRSRLEAARKFAREMPDFEDRIEEKAQQKIQQLLNEYRLSPRTYKSLCKFSENSANLSESKNITTAHVQHAADYNLVIQMQDQRRFLWNIK